MCQRTPRDEADLPDWLADHINDPKLLGVVLNGGWRYAAAFYRGLFLKAVQRETEAKIEIEKLNGKIRYLQQQVFGRKSESKSGSDKAPDETAGENDQNASSEPPRPPKRKRGAQPGHVGHPRKQRPLLPRVDQPLALLEEQKRCPQCGQQHSEFPPRYSSRIEYEVKIFEVRYEHERARKECQCQGTPGIIEAAAPPSVIPKSRYGTSVWLEALLDKYYLHHPSNHFVRSWALLEEGGMSPGVLNGGLRRLQPLFDPVYELIVERNLQAGHWHADETGWPVFGEPRKEHGRARWQLWVFQSKDSVVYVIRPSRSADVPMEHFPENTVAVIIVDRYSGYKRLANVYDGIILAFCWVHVRRDFLNAAKKHQGELEPWALSWVSDISELYKRYDARKEKLEACADQHPELCLEAKVEVVASEEQQALKEHVERMEARCKKELVALEDPIATESKGGAKAKRQRHRELAHREEKGKVLRSLSMHWCGLTLFIDYPEIPLDNNSAERALRGGAVARKNYYGSGAQWSIRLNECLFSLVATLEACKINVRTWMSHYLDHCASLGGKPPDKETIREWLPWNMTEAMRQKMSAPLALPPPPPKAESGADAISANTS